METEKRLNRNLKLKVLVLTLGSSCCISILFYRSWWGTVWSPVLYFILKKKLKEKEIEGRKALMLEQFMQGIQVLSTALQASLSMENAWREVQKEMELLYGEESIFLREVKEINRCVALNHSIENGIMEFAQRVQIEEITQFSELLSYGKRSGGNWRKIIGNVVERLREKYEAQKQIEVLLAEKKLEQQVMNLIPLGILAFLQISSWDYMRVMYHNTFGVLCMTGILIGYMISILIAEKIMRIRV